MGRTVSVCGGLSKPSTPSCVLLVFSRMISTYPCSAQVSIYVWNMRSINVKNYYYTTSTIVYRIFKVSGNAIEVFVLCFYSHLCKGVHFHTCWTHCTFGIMKPSANSSVWVQSLNRAVLNINDVKQKICALSGHPQLHKSQLIISCFEVHRVSWQ